MFIQTDCCLSFRNWALSVTLKIEVKLHAKHMHVTPYINDLIRYLLTAQIFFRNQISINNWCLSYGREAWWKAYAIISDLISHCSKERRTHCYSAFVAHWINRMKRDGISLADFLNSTSFFFLIYKFEMRSLYSRIWRCVCIYAPVPLHRTIGILCSLVIPWQ